MKSIYALLLLCIVSMGYAQSDVDSLLFSSKLKKMPLDQDLFLHLNQTKIAQGDTLWFKGYALQGPLQQISQLSSSLTVALVNQEKKSVYDTQYLMFEGTSEGQIVIPQELQPGFYQFVAYTSNMVNYTDRHFFRTPIEVVKKKVSSTNLAYQFHQPYYKPGETLNLLLHNFDRSLQDLAANRIRYSLVVDGKEIEKYKATTNAQGEVDIRIPYPSGELVSDTSIVQLVLESGNVDERETSSIRIPNAQHDCDVQLLPEGGELILGIPQVVAFRVVDYYGRPVEVKGVVKDRNGEELAECSSSSEGMGKLMIEPLANETYSFEITSPEKYKKTIPFPEVREKGVSLSLRLNKGNTLYFSVRTNMEQAVKLSGVLQMDGVVLAREELLVSGEQIVKMPINDTPVGIAKFTLLTEEGSPVAERLVFVDSEWKNDLAINGVSEQYLPRQKVNVTLKTLANAEKLEGAMLSATVTEISKGTSSLVNLPDVREWAIFQPEFKSKVNNPSQYFDYSTPKRILDYKRDMLVLTHGWRTYPWVNEWSQRSESSFVFCNYDAYLGVVSKGKKPVPHAKVSVFPMEEMASLGTFKTDDQGRFNFTAKFQAKANPTLVFHAERKSKLSRTALSIRDREREMRDTLIDRFVDEITHLDYTRNAQEMKQNETKEDIFQLWDTEYIEEVTVAAERQKSEEEEYLDQLGGAAAMSRSFDPSEYEDFSLSMENIVANLGGGLCVTNDTLYRRAMGDVRPVPIILDEVLIDYDYYQIASLTSSDVLRVVFSENNISNLPADADPSIGALFVWIDKSAKNRETSLNRNAYIAKRFEDPCTFYKPKYETMIEKTMPIEDNRVTMHWENDIKLDENGKASFAFYTSDMKGKYIINIQGVTKESGVVFLEKEFVVQ